MDRAGSHAPTARSWSVRNAPIHTVSAGPAVALRRYRARPVVKRLDRARAMPCHQAVAGGKRYLRAADDADIGAVGEHVDNTAHVMGLDPAAGVDPDGERCARGGERPIEAGRDAALRVVDDLEAPEPAAGGGFLGLLDGVVVRRAVGQDHFELRERRRPGRQWPPGIRRCRPPRCAPGPIPKRRSSTPAPLPSEHAAHGAADDPEHRGDRLWWRRYQNSYWSFSRASRLVAGVAVLDLRPAGQARADEVAHVVERQLLAELLRRTAAAPGGDRRSTGRRATMLTTWGSSSRWVAPQQLAERVIRGSSSLRPRRPRRRRRAAASCGT